MARKSGGLVLGPARWGFVPRWWKQARPPRLSHNARLEEAATKPMWRDAMQRGRALLPALGWYEWREDDRQPYFFRPADGSLAALAALFSVIEGRVTCAVLTEAARGPAASVHARMPVVLGSDAQSKWLDGGEVPAAPPSLEFHPVRRLLNSATAEDAELIEQAGA